MDLFCGLSESNDGAPLSLAPDACESGDTRGPAAVEVFLKANCPKLAAADGPVFTSLPNRFGTGAFPDPIGLGSRFVEGARPDAVRA